MKIPLLLLAISVVLTGAPQGDKTPQPAPQDKTQTDKRGEKTKEVFDPEADPKEEFARRADKAMKEQRYDELKQAAAELAELSRKMNDEIAAGNREVISIKLQDNLNRAEKLVKTMRDKSK